MYSTLELGLELWNGLYSKRWIYKSNRPIVNIFWGYMINPPAPPPRNVSCVLPWAGPSPITNGTSTNLLEVGGPDPTFISIIQPSERFIQTSWSAQPSTLSNITYGSARFSASSCKYVGEKEVSIKKNYILSNFFLMRIWSLFISIHIFKIYVWFLIDAFYFLQTQYKNHPQSLNWGRV